MAHVLPRFPVKISLSGRTIGAGAPVHRKAAVKELVPKTTEAGCARSFTFLCVSAAQQVGAGLSEQQENGDFTYPSLNLPCARGAGW